MRLAMIVRCRERGLGTMTWEIARHLQPEKVLVVHRDDVDFRDDERFPGAMWVDVDRGRLPDEALRWLTTDVDVLYTAETPYDFRLFDLARRQGVGTVLHGMFEYLPYRRDRRLPRPDLFCAPNPWRLDEWPTPVEYLPVPIAVDRFERRHVRHVRRVVHAGGAVAKGDRNGTTSLLAALPFIRTPVEVVIRYQTPVRRPIVSGPAKLTLAPPSNNYWTVFDGADAAILPRRYGGLSLPLQEASALGLPIIGLSREHDAGYHHAAVVRCTERPMGLPCGPIDRAEVEPLALARAIEHLVEEPETAMAMSECSWQAARGLTWEALMPLWRSILASVAR